MNRTMTNYTLVVGMGKTGTAIAGFLKNLGENVVVTDMDRSKEKAATMLRKIGVKTEIGRHDITTFENARAIVVSPGVPLDIKELAAARKKGVPVTGELDVVSAYMDRKVVAVTGTNGKTTTTELIGSMLKFSNQKVFVGGNIGTPIVDYITSKNEIETVVLEISSFQLDTSKKFKPDIAVLLNISQDHQNRYACFNDYVDSKWSIFRNQTETDTAIINFRLKDLYPHIKKIKSRIWLFNSEGDTNGYEGAVIRDNQIVTPNGTVDISCSHLKGLHNRENIAAAALAAFAAGATPAGISLALKNFRPLPHRLAYAGSVNGVDFYNDSKATNPDAVKRALECFDSNTLLIMGGQEKGTDFTDLKQIVGEKVKRVIAMGEAKEKILQSFGNVCEVISAKEMKEAVKLAYKNAGKGDRILLSPGCASFDKYKNYEERGLDFINQIERLESS